MLVLTPVCARVVNNQLHFLPGERARTKKLLKGRDLPRIRNSTSARSILRLAISNVAPLTVHLTSSES